jgi:hypothetical protein
MAAITTCAQVHQANWKRQTTEITEEFALCNYPEPIEIPPLRRFAPGVGLRRHRQVVQQVRGD